MIKYGYDDQGRLLPFYSPGGGGGDDDDPIEDPVIDVVEDDGDDDKKKKQKQIQGWQQELINLIQLKMQQHDEYVKSTGEKIEKLIGKLESVGIDVKDILTKSEQKALLAPPPVEPVEDPLPPPKRSKYDRHGF